MRVGMIEANHNKTARVGFLTNTQDLMGRNQKTDFGAWALVHQGPRLPNRLGVAHQGTTDLAVRDPCLI
jgi:hypothetical protein